MKILNCTQEGQDLLESDGRSGTTVYFEFIRQRILKSAEFEKPV